MGKTAFTGANRGNRVCSPLPLFPHVQAISEFGGRAAVLPCRDLSGRPRPFGGQGTAGPTIGIFGLRLVGGIYTLVVMLREMRAVSAGAFFGSADGQRAYRLRRKHVARGENGMRNAKTIQTLDIAESALRANVRDDARRRMRLSPPRSVAAARRCQRRMFRGSRFTAPTCCMKNDETEFVSQVRTDTGMIKVVRVTV